MPWSSVCSIYFRFSHQNILNAFTVWSVHAICPALLILLELTSLVTHRLVVYSSVLKMEPVGLVDTLAHFYQVKRRYIPGDRSLLLLYLASYSAAHSFVL